MLYDPNAGVWQTDRMVLLVDIHGLSECLSRWKAPATTDETKTSEIRVHPTVHAIPVGHSKFDDVVDEFDRQRMDCRRHAIGNKARALEKVERRALG